MHIDDHRGRCARLSKLLDAQGKRQGVKAGASVLAGDQNPEQTSLRGGPDSLLREPVIAVDFGREGLDHTLRQLPYRRSKGRMLRSEFEIQVKRYLE